MPKTHGHTTKEGWTPEYKSWKAMLARCFNPRHKSYAEYGGAGIKVFDGWLNFSNFLKDMGQRPPGTSLDRIDSRGDYTPGNCRWSTYEVQSNNRKNVRVTAKQMVGVKYGMWLVLDVVQSKPRVKVSVVCDCGKKKIADAANVKRGGSTNCGCVRLRRMKTNNPRKRTAC